MAWTEMLGKLVPGEVRDRVARMPKSVGDYGFDPWGYRDDEALLGFTLAKFLHDHYYRVQSVGLEHVPATGRALIIANHSGNVFPIDAMLIAAAIFSDPDKPRACRAMIERFFPKTPFLGNLVNRFGAVLGDPQNCRKMLEREEAVIVFPEGEHGFVKHFRDRYKLQRMGTGFIRMAVDCRAPIIPVGVVGCEETTPGLGRAEKLARIFGMPTLPLAAPVALPTRVHLHFGAPILCGPELNTEAKLEAELHGIEQVIESLIADGLEARGDRIF